VTFAVN
jgi:hypothetical protein